MTLISPTSSTSSGGDLPSPPGTLGNHEVKVVDQRSLKKTRQAIAIQIIMAIVGIALIGALIAVGTLAAPTAPLVTAGCVLCTAAALGTTLYVLKELRKDIKRLKKHHDINT